MFHVSSAMGKSRSTTILIAYLLSASLTASKQGSLSVAVQSETNPDQVHPARLSLKAGSDKDSQQQPLDPEAALSLIRVARSFAEPNTGFMTQLELYHRMGCPTDLDSHPEYQRWLYQRAVEESNSRGVAPDMVDIRFSDEAEASRARDEELAAGTSTAAADGGRSRGGGQQASTPSAVSSSSSSSTTDPATARENNPSSPKFTYRCRRCRTQLATSSHTADHEPPPPPTLPPPSSLSPAGRAAATAAAGGTNPAASPPPCAHIFLQPLSWMRPGLEQGLLSGRLECPNGKCKTVVGRYAWQGVKCSCGQWVVPGLGLARSKVDEILDLNAATVRGRM